MFCNYSLSSPGIPTNWKDVPKLTILLMLFSALAQQSWGQTTILTDPGATYGNSDGPTGPDVYSVNVSNCTSVSFSVDYSFSDDFVGSGNMETPDECNFSGFPCAGDPTNPGAGDCNMCWDFLWVVFNIDGTNVGEDLIGDVGTADIEQSGTIVGNNFCTNGATTADMTIVTQTWASSESITFNNIAIVCYEAAPSITTNAPFCVGSTLTLDGDATDPSSVVSWMWSNNGSGTIANPSAQNTTASNPSNGETYTLITTDPNGCTGEATETVGVVSAPTATISANPSSACSGATVTFTFTGTPNAIVTYFDGSSNQTVTLNGAGMATVNTTAGSSNITYTLIDITLGSCMATLSDSATVTIAPPPTANISVAPMTACQNTAVNFTFTGTPNATVTYFDGASNQTVILDGSGNASVPDFTGTIDITYSLVSVSLNGCTGPASGSATVVVTANPSATISVSPSNACPGELVIFTFSGTPNAIITYNDGSSNNVITLSPTGFSTITVPLGSSDLTYSLLSAELNNCVEPLADAATVFVLPPPTATISAVPMFACEGDLVTFIFSGTPNATVTFFNGSFNQSLVLDASGFNSTGTIALNSDITYTLLDVTLGACSQSLNDPVTVTVTPSPTAGISVNPTTACSGEIAIFTFIGTPDATVTYDDGFGSQIVVLDGTGFADVTIILGAADVTYILLDVSLNGCSQPLGDAATVIISPAPFANISVNPTTACENENVVFTFTGTPNATITYNDGISNQDIILNASGIATTNAITGSSNMTFTLIAATLGNCSGSLNESVTVTVIPPPTATISVAPTSVCEGALVTFTISGTPNADVSYTDPTGSQTITLDASGIFQTTIPTSSISITYILTAASLNNCTAVLNEFATVDVTPLPNATISVTPATACEGAPVTFTFSGTPNSTVTYDNEVTNTTILLDNNGSATVTITAGSNNFTYSLISVDFANCIQTLNDAATVSIAPTPTATVSVTPISACEEEEVNFTFSGTANAIITYNTGGPDQNITLDGSGMATLPLTLGNTDITVTLVNALLGNCDNALTNNATAMVIPIPIANPASLSACDEGTGQASFDLTSINAAIGSGIIQWFDAIQAPIGNPANYNSGPTTIFATLTVNGCTSELVAVSLTLDPLPVFNNLSDDCTASNLDYVVSFDISGGTAPYTVTGGTGTLTGTQFTSDPIAIGTAYSFFITDANDCGPVEVSGNNLVCDCITDAGNMDNNTLNPCVGETITATHAADETLDGDDILLFVLHDNAGNSLGTIFATNSSPDFDLSAIAGLLPNTLYYISAVAANDNGTGTVDQTDLCLSVSQGTPFIIHELPNASIQQNAFICPLGCTSIMVTLTGTPPFSVDYEINHPVTGIQMLTEVTNDAFFLVDVCGDDAMNTTITVTLNTITDAFCDRVIPLDFCSIEVGNNDATGEETHDGCQGDGYSVVVNNIIYNEATPDGTELITAFNGCDSLVTIDLNFSETLTGTESYVGCQGDGYSVVVNGETYDEATPSGMETITSNSSCDSIVTIDLSFLPDLSGTESYTGCLNDGYSVIVNGTTYDQDTPNGMETVTSSIGCDSVITIILVFNDILTGTEEYSGCSGDGYSVVVNGETYNEATPLGTETMTSSSSNCDSIVTINLSYTLPVNGEALHNGCTGDGYSITLNGNLYNEAIPTGTETIPSSTGCDSIVTINLTYNQALTGTESHNGCTGDGYSVTVNGTIYNEGFPNGMETLIGTGGCDSIVTITLTFADILMGEEGYIGCDGDGYSVTVNNVIYNQGNPIGTETLPSNGGCDSIVTINLVYNNILTGEENYTGCSGNGYTISVNGTIYNESNSTGTETLNSSLNCDSIVSINLVFNESYMLSNNYNGCTDDGYSIVVNGTTYNQLNTDGTENMLTVNGCDSIVVIDLSFSDLLTGTESYNGCQSDGYDVLVNGTLYNEGNNSGAETLMSSNGCDSLVIIDLVYAPSTFGEEIHDGCLGDGYSVLVNGTLYNEGNPIGTETILNGVGCDSIVSINLAFNSSVSGEETYNGCNGDGYEVTVNGAAYNEGNPTGIETLISGGGCDSIVTITLTFNSFLTGGEFYTGCENDGYEVIVGGTAYNEGNQNGVETVVSSIGCDSIVSIALTFLPELSGTESYNGCENDGYVVLVNGVVYNEGNPVGTETLTGSTGCDSIVIINLMFSNSLAGTELYMGCENDGYSVMVNGTLYNEANPTGTEMLISNSNCDSIVIINLTYTPSSNGNESYNGCIGDGYEITVNGTTYNEGNSSGTELLSNNFGCDSIVTINLNFSNTLNGTENYMGCSGDGYTVMVNGTIYNEGNPNGMETLATATCDSIVIINLTFNATSTGDFERNGCEGDGFEITIDGTLYNEANPTGTALLAGANYLGCDSIVTITLSFSNVFPSNINETLCEDEFLVINGTTYDIGNPTGTENLPGGSFAGCDSLINVNLAFYPTVTASLDATDFICPGDSTLITFNLEGGNSYNVVFDNGGTVLNLINIADGHTIMVTPSTTTTYSILDVSDPSIPCTPTLQSNSVTISFSNITVIATVQSDFDGFGISCSGSADGSTLATAENGQAPYAYSWNNGTNGETTDNLNAGTYMVTATDAIGCTAEATITLTEPTLVQVSGMATAPTCFGDADGSIILDTIFGGNGPYEFSIDGQFFGSIDAFPYTIPFVESGLQEVIIQDVNDCVVSYNTTVPAPSLNFIDLGGDQIITLGESYEIPTVPNFDIDTFFWSTLEFMDCNTCLNPLVNPSYTTMYAIQAVDANGCSAFNEVTISVEKPRAVYIPNAFSPNGDASNQNFTVYANREEVVQVNFLRVFDRWGELVFQNSDFSANDERIGWDGSFKGDVVQPGVFVYVAEVLFADGILILYKGDLTVVK
ncbi:MAG: gliding motility-associated-like protein [Polaribacter sp.]|jgi:gliding motility-associated-like protein